MQARPAYPVDTVTGGCFVTRRYEIAPGEQICDLDCDLDALPAWGRLCVSELGVRMMANCLGIEIPERDLVELNAELVDENDRLRAENVKMRRVFTKVMHAVELAGIVDYADKLTVS